MLLLGQVDSGLRLAQLDVGERLPASVWIVKSSPALGAQALLMQIERWLVGLRLLMVHLLPFVEFVL